MSVRPSITQIRTLTDFVTTYQWGLRFDTLPKAISNKPDSSNLNVRCISTTIPKLTNTPLETSIRGHKVWQPGIHNYTQNIVLTMAENIDMLVNTFIANWREACWQSSTGRHSSKDDVECNITLIRFNRQDEPIWNYHLVGCFLADYEQGELNTESALFRPTLTINYDFFTDSKGEAPRKVPDSKGGVSSGSEGSFNSGSIGG